MKIGWGIKRETGGSHRVLEREGWPDYVFAFNDSTEISKLTLHEKLHIMQSIWEDLRSHVDRFGLPQSHKEILDERRRRVESGEAQLLDRDEVKNSIGKR